MRKVFHNLGNVSDYLTVMEAKIAEYDPKPIEEVKKVAKKGKGAKAKGGAKPTFPSKGKKK